MTARRPGTRVYLSAVGQADNLGDTVLRRAFIAAAGGDGRRHIAIGRHSADYLSNLGLRPDDRCYRSAARWAGSALLSALRRPTVLANFAGEALSKPHSVVNYALGGLLARAARLRGGGAAITGVGMRAAPHRSAVLALRWLAGGCAVVEWRDAATAELIGRGEAGPDWAFATRSEPDSVPEPVPGSEPEPDHRRPLLVVSMRGDRPPISDVAVGGIRRAADALGLQVCTVAQVRRDNRANAELLDRIGGDLAVQWGSESHREYEVRIRAIHRRAVCVIGDRLHALIIAATEGAVPVALGNGPMEKAERSFAVIGYPDVVARPVAPGPDAPGQVAPGPAVTWPDGDVGELAVADAIVRAAGRGAEIGLAVAAARARLDRLTRDIDRLAGRVAATEAAKVDRIAVMQSVKPPDGTTRFVDQVVSRLPEGVDVDFLSARAVLRRRIDVFHVHWPEYLVTGRRRTTRVTRAALSSLLLLRLRLGRVAIVRTLHNPVPHDASDRRWERLLLRRWDRSTDLFIRLNPATEVPAGKPAVDIPHGDYQERFAPFPRRAADPDLVLTFGLIRRYKGIEGLADSFCAQAPARRRLRIVGQPVDAGVVDHVRRSAAADPRVSTRFAFVPDADLVLEVTGASLVVLPYREMHNSGALLVALSVGRPVLVPRSAANEALAAEVGPGWVYQFDGSLTWAEVEDTLVDVAGSAGGRRPAGPNLRGRDWASVGAKHGRAYRVAIGLRTGRG